AAAPEGASASRTRSAGIIGERIRWRGASAFNHFRYTSREHRRPALRYNISQVPAVVVWIVVQHDLVGIPKPAVGVIVVGWRHTKIGAIEPETVLVPPGSR